MFTYSGCIHKRVCVFIIGRLLISIHSTVPSSPDSGCVWYAYLVLQMRTYYMHTNVYREIRLPKCTRWKRCPRKLYIKIKALASLIIRCQKHLYSKCEMIHQIQIEFTSSWWTVKLLKKRFQLNKNTNNLNVYLFKWNFNV